MSKEVPIHVLFIHACTLPSIESVPNRTQSSIDSLRLIKPSLSLILNRQFTWLLIATKEFSDTQSDDWSTSTVRSEAVL